MTNANDSAILKRRGYDKKYSKLILKYTCNVFESKFIKCFIQFCTAEGALLNSCLYYVYTKYLHFSVFTFS